MNSNTSNHPWKRVPGYGGYPPCNDCNKRHVGCQVDCEKYMAWSAAKEEKKAKRSEYINTVKDANSFRNVGAQRVIKKRRSK